MLSFFHLLLDDKVLPRISDTDYLQSTWVKLISFPHINPSESKLQILPLAFDSEKPLHGRSRYIDFCQYKADFSGLVIVHLHHWVDLRATRDESDLQIFRRPADEGDEALITEKTSTTFPIFRDECIGFRSLIWIWCVGDVNHDFA